MNNEKRPRRNLPWDLIERAFNGDRAAERCLIDHYRRVVRQAIEKKLRCWPGQRGRYDEDTEQEVWLFLMEDGWRRLRRYDPGRGMTFDQFLAMAAAGRASNLARRRHNQADRDAGGFKLDQREWDCAMELILREDLMEKLERLISQRLPDKDLKLYIGYYFDGRKLKDIGAELGWADSTTYVRKYRLDKKLLALAKELLPDLFDDGDGPEEVSMSPVAVALAVLIVLLMLESG